LGSRSPIVDVACEQDELSQLAAADLRREFNLPEFEMQISEDVEAHIWRPVTTADRPVA
jgi:hypothetical protein